PVQVQIRPFDYPGSDTQRVTAIVNGTRLAEQVLVNDWQTVEWSVPGRGLVDSVNRLCLEWGYNAVPRRVLGGNRLIGSTGVELPIDADIKAFAEGGFISLFDEAGSQTDASAGRRGVNVTVLDSHGGVVDAAGFDTAANTFESEKLAAYIADIPDGAPVLVATKGDAAAFLTDDALAALNSLGGDVTLDKLRGNYLALAGIKGAALGSAAQVIDPYEAFLRISLNRDRRTLAGAVGEVAIGRLGD
ncbi:MAG: interleukin-like EMT inducer domain-containing protein, partial [Caldilineaceae bacterium]